ncbi:unnamed protein product [Musa hybrid cultivar]
MTFQLVIVVVKVHTTADNSELDFAAVTVGYLILFDCWSEYITTHFLASPLLHLCNLWNYCSCWQRRNMY